jgi:hypothetical protein
MRLAYLAHQRRRGPFHESPECLGVAILGIGTDFLSVHALKIAQVFV